MRAVLVLVFALCAGRGAAQSSEDMPGSPVGRFYPRYVQRNMGADSSGRTVPVHSFYGAMFTSSSLEPSVWGLTASFYAVEHGGSNVASLALETHSSSIGPDSVMGLRRGGGDDARNPTNVQSGQTMGTFFITGQGAGVMRDPQPGAANEGGYAWECYSSETWTASYGITCTAWSSITGATLYTRRFGFGSDGAFETYGSAYRTGCGSTATGCTASSFIGVGAAGSGTGTVGSAQGLTLPTNISGDLLLLAIQTENDPATCPAGYTTRGPQTGFGIAKAAGTTRLTLCWKRSSGAESVPTVADSGDHTYVVIASFRGVAAAGDPTIFISSGVKETASTSMTIPGGRVPYDNLMIVQVAAHAVDGGTGAQYSSQANAQLATLTERFDASTADGDGGGIMILTGFYTAAGDLGATTGTVTSTAEAYITIALAQVNTWTATAAQVISQTPRTPDVQMFRGGGADTWVKPQGAKHVDIVMLGAGGRGGAGNTTGTAAGGGGGGGGAYQRAMFLASELQSTLTLSVGVRGIGGATKSAATSSTVTNNGIVILSANLGSAGVDGANNDSGDGGAGGSVQSLPTALSNTACQTLNACQGSGSMGGGAPTTASASTTQNPGGRADFGGAAGGAGNLGANNAGTGGTSNYGGGGGGGGTVSGAAGVGGVGGGAGAGGVEDGSATATGISTLGGSGGGGGDVGAGGNGGFPGGGGGGGSGDAINNGGNGADGVIVIITAF